MKKFVIPLIICVVLILTVSACADGDGNVYIAEDVISSVEKDSEKWAEIEDMLGMLTVDSADIPEFDGTKEAFGLFRDSLLNHMCCSSYRKYAGNSQVLDAINEENPGIDAIAAISASEFESSMYRVFGGNVKLTHVNTELFTYLKDSGVYVPVTSPIEGGVDFELLSVDETENTYRIEFRSSAGDYTGSYFALLIKRDDGSCYFNLLMKH